MIIKNPDGTQTYLETAGDPAGEAVILLHGIGADHKMWEEQIDFLTAHGFYLIMPDLLGHGRSSRVSSLSLSDWKKQLDSLFIPLDIQQVIIIGVSMGGVIAQYYAVQEPARINKLVLADTFGQLVTFLERILGYSQIFGYHLFKLVGKKALSKGMASAYKAPFASRAKTYFQHCALQADFSQLILARKAINKIDAIGKIPGKSIPTLVMVGDQFGPSFIRINRKIANSIPGAKFVILENAMDPSNLVNPDRFNQELEQFLR